MVSSGQRVAKSGGEGSLLLWRFMLLSQISITKPAESKNIIREERFPFSTPGSTTAGPNHSQNLTLIVACVAYAKEAHTGSEGRCTICCRHASRSVLPAEVGLSHRFFVWHFFFSSRLGWCSVYFRTSSKRMHWMDARALRRKDAFRGERPWGDTVCDPWISDRETVSKLRG